MWDISFREVAHRYGGGRHRLAIPKDEPRGYQGGGTNRRGSRRSSHAMPWQGHDVRLTGCVPPLRADDPELNVPIGAGKLSPRNAVPSMARQWQPGG